jgi:hypothetical protein
MMGACEQCIFFRPVKLASELLRQATDTTDATVSNALLDIRKNETEQARFEAQERIILGQAYNPSSGNLPMWSHRPIMTPYCGMKENEGIYLVDWLKNAGGRCKDFTPGMPPQNRSCNTCAHRVKAQGVHSDQQMLASRLGMIQNSITFGLLPTLPQDQLKNYHEGIAPRKSFEVTQAYQTQGRLQTEPQYLDYCARFSTADNYVICALHNRHNTCSAHSAFQNTDPMPQQAETIVMTEFGKTYECGGYGFQIGERLPMASISFGVSKELVVLQPRGNEGHPPKNHYHLKDIATNQWIALKSFKGEQLPVYIKWNGVIMQVRVGPAPEGRISVLGVSNWSSEGKFEVQLNGPHTKDAHFKHPSGALSMTYGYGYTSGDVRNSRLAHRFRVSSPLAENFDEYVLEGLAEGKWMMLQRPDGTMLPVKVKRDKNRASVEWLPLEMLTQQSNSAQSGTGRAGTPPSSNTGAAKVAGGLALVGLTVLAKWLADKPKGKEK